MLLCLRIERTLAAEAKTFIFSLTSSLVPITVCKFFLSVLGTEPEASRDPTSVPEQR